MWRDEARLIEAGTPSQFMQEQLRQRAHRTAAAAQHDAKHHDGAKHSSSTDTAHDSRHGSLLSRFRNSARTFSEKIVHPFRSTKSTTSTTPAPIAETGDESSLATRPRSASSIAMEFDGVLPPEEGGMGTPTALEDEQQQQQHEMGEADASRPSRESGNRSLTSSRREASAGFLCFGKRRACCASTRASHRYKMR